MNNLAKQTKTVIYNYVICVFVSISLIVTLNHYGLKAIDGIRAFTTGESFYMKAQQEASISLTNYVFTSKPEHYRNFIANLQVPINDSLARVALDSNKNAKIIKKHLLLGKNIPEDLDNILWVYQNFKSLSGFKKAIRIWKEADLMAIKLEKLGKHIHQIPISNPTISYAQKEALAIEIDQLCKLLTKKGNEFDRALSDNIKLVNRTVLTINTLIAFIIFICIVVISVKYIHKLSRLQKDTLDQNDVLMKTNEELDLFTHSVSHDLRSPITSLKGIVSLAETEENAKLRSEYFSLMKQILSRQDEFILKIIQFSKNKRTDLHIKEVYLPSFFEVISQNLQYGLEIAVDIKYNVAPITIRIDTFRLDIICNNLISNSLKYADPDKPSSFIYASAYLSDGLLHISIEDNGIGISEEHLPKIFDMFYVTSHHNKGSGIGLYLVKEMINKLGGNITIHSAIKKGSVFTIQLPVIS